MRMMSLDSPRRIARLRTLQRIAVVLAGLAGRHVARGLPGLDLAEVAYLLGGATHPRGRWCWGG
jgi:hypothetical protein